MFHAKLYDYGTGDGMKTGRIKEFEIQQFFDDKKITIAKYDGNWTHMPQTELDLRSCGLFFIIIYDIELQIFGDAILQGLHS